MAPPTKRARHLQRARNAKKTRNGGLITCNSPSFPTVEMEEEELEEEEEEEDEEHIFSADEEYTGDVEVDAHSSALELGAV
ncbi:MAG: hypothetical protein BJ554DRAFT_6516, partial [Olpidium bornovanus]